MEHLIIVVITVIAVFIAIGLWKAIKKTAHISKGSSEPIENKEENKTNPEGDLGQ